MNLPIGLIGDASLVSLKISRGAWDLVAMEKRAAFKELHYCTYDAAGWAFLPLFSLAELQTECALQCECVGDNPAEVLHMFATRSRSKVACTVAVGTATDASCWVCPRRPQHS